MPDPFRHILATLTGGKIFESGNLFFLMLCNKCESYKLGSRVFSIC